MKKVLTIIFILTYCSINGYGQSKQAYIDAAESSFMKKDYYSALSYYLEAAEFQEESDELYYNIAESARLFNAYGIAEDYYQRTLEIDERGNYPLATFWLASVKQKMGKYEEAIDYYRLFVSENGGDNPYYYERANKEIKASEWALQLNANENSTVDINALDNGVNTGYSEFGGLGMEKELYYSSLRFEQKKPDNKPPRLISKILKSSEMDASEVLSFQKDGEDIHRAHTSFSIDHSKMYFTICDYKNASELRCDIYYRKIDAAGNYGEEVKLPDFINLPTSTNTQPSIGFDKDLNKEILYFTSDREGGKGKLDIWYSVIDNGAYSPPMNLSVINTIENDITPFFHNLSQTFYFSSTGYQGVGGYDIYRSYKQDGSFGKVEHLGVPTNSSYDDIYYSISDDEKLVYLSSNREGSMYIDEDQEACCFDIYRLDITPAVIKLNALTFDKATQLELNRATVKLYDQSTGELIAEVTNELGNDHLFDLESGRNYMIVAERSPYESDTVYLSTTQMTSSQEITKKLFLGLGDLSLDVFTFEEQSGMELDGVTIQLIDLLDNSLKDEITYNPNGNDFHFPLQKGRTYKIIASKEGYNSVTAIVDTNKDLGDSGKIVKKMYLRKRDLNVYLPVWLYFDNDRPGRKSTSIVTNKTYSDTYFPYIDRKTYFKNRTAGSLRGEEQRLAKQGMEDFFEFDVKGGYEKLNLFVNSLLTKMEAGQSLEIQIKGYTSPLAATKYNLALGQRRVQSVRNELSKFAGGRLIPYMDNGQLKIIDISFGEQLAPAHVNDQYDNTKESIYSVAASKERRVEIVRVNQTN